MELFKSPIEGLFVFTPDVFTDDRGYFFESFNQRSFQKLGITATFVQDNQSFSKYGTIRGLHFQKGTFAQAKLVRVLTGSILDVTIDLRPGSSTYGKHFSVELTAENRKQMYIPRGFAHGFSVLSETASVLYKCDNFYNRDSEGGISFNDPTLKIDWKIPLDRMILTEKDLKFKNLDSLTGPIL
jgi:dTDP-4-dehydrorhamnose 3,5-epimerase